MIFVPYFAVSYGQQVEEISKSSKYCHCNILERQKVLNHGIKLENNKATPSRKFNTREGLAVVVETNDSVNKCTLLIQITNKPLSATCSNITSLFTTFGSFTSGLSFFAE